MIFDVSKQLKGPVGSRCRFQVSQMGDPPVSGALELVRTERGIFVCGELQAKLQLVCSRCLVSFEKPVLLKIEEEYLSRAEERAFAIDEHGEIELSEAVRQYMLLASPMKPLCREDCAGLCPVCGHNLNQGTCECPPGHIDPRFEPLACLMNGGI